MSLEEQARRSFNSGYNCAESVLLAVGKETELVARSFESFIPRIATGLGGGIARNGDVCGALTGATMAIGLALGRDSPDQNRDPCYTAVDSFYNEFKEAFGSCRCRDITGLDLKNPKQREAYQSRIHYDRCNPIVGWAAKRAHDIIRESRR
jgi:C_GCAxxG_C_C family probable redox protein